MCLEGKVEENPSAMLLGHRPQRKVVNHDQKEIDDVCEIFSQGAKEVIVPEA